MRLLQLSRLLALLIGVATAFLPLAASAQLRISEFQADNLDTLDDEETRSSDWIEIHNSGTEEVDLQGWSLTDDADNPSKWQFPEGLSLAPDAYLVVFASKKNKHTKQSIFQQSPIKLTHTNFKLALDGEYLALVRPDGETVEHEFAPAYPLQVSNTSYGINAEGEQVYYTEPTPGEANRGGSPSIGPIIEEVTNITGIPNLEEVSDMIISAEITATDAEIAEVTLYYRLMFRSEASTPMRDDGVAPDALAGDGIYTAKFGLTSLFGTLVNPGEMIRWRVEAADAAGLSHRLPLHHDPVDSDQYFGTIVHKDGWETSNLPILHWFVENPRSAETENGTSCSVFYEGEFYDNVQFDIHGQSTRGFPKKAYDIDFNKGHRFKYREDEDRVKDINLLTNWADKSKVRNTVAYGIQAAAGIAAHFAFPIRIEQNGEFHSTADIVEDGDDRYLKRAGLREDGALYKMYNTFDNVGGAEKKSRKWEDDRDLGDFIARLTQGSREERKAFTYDNVNISDMVNFLAIKAIYNNTDFGHKNYYAYRDTGGTDEWTFLPWDVDLSLGRLWTGSETYFRDAMEARNSVTAGSNNRLVSTLYTNPDFEIMFYRRLRTLMDRFYGEPGGAPEDTWFMDKLDELSEAIDPEGVISDADLDYEKWGSWGNNNDMQAGLARIRDEFIPQRREYLYGLSQIPPAQKPDPTVTFDEVVFRAESGNPEEEYLVLKNSTGAALDISDWTISGAIDYTIRPGTVIPDSASIFSPDGGKLYVVRNSKAFRARSQSPKGGEGLLLQGGYRGQLSARGETLILRDREGNVIAEHTYAGAPSLAQASLRITEIMYRPLPAAGDPTYPGNAYEFVELKNIGDSALSLAGVYFSDGIEHAFAGDSVLEPGAYGVLVKNEAAFRSRYGTDIHILGTYIGSLNNGGESIQLRDADDENILSFEYENSWSMQADAEGHSLVIRDDTADFDAWKLPESWTGSQAVMGSPGSADGDEIIDPGGGQGTYTAWGETHFTAEELADPTRSGPAGDVNRDGISNLLAYAMNLDPHALINGSHLPSGIYNTASEVGLRFRRRAGSEDLVYRLEHSTDLQSWSVIEDAIEPDTPVDLGDGAERVTLVLPPGVSGAQAYLRLHIELTPAVE